MQNQGEHRTLWFVVDGDPAPASQVTVPIDVKIDGLIKAINKERVRLGCPTIRMLLWKLITPIPVSNFVWNALDTTVIDFPDPNSDEAFGGNGSVQRLRVDHDVFHYWREHPDETKVHIIAQQSVNPYLNAYVRLRTHLWGQNRVNIISAAGNSYPTVDLTRFDLPQLNSLRIKTLLIRNEYSLACHAIRETAAQSRSIFLITGQPGIGKTLFLLYFLVRLLQERVPVALQIDAHNFVLFDNRGVREYKTTSLCASAIPSGAWTFSDSSGEQQPEPCAAFQHSEAHIIHTSSSAAHCWKHWAKVLDADRYIMDVWSLKEFQGLLAISGLNIQRGVDLFRKYGSNIRALISILNKPPKEAQYLSDGHIQASTSS